MACGLYLVTGSSSGIGFAIAQSLLERGHHVIGVSRMESEKTNYLLENYPEAYVHELKDLGDDIDSLPKWVVGLSKQYGKLAGFVHSAGVQQILPLQVNSYKNMLTVFNVNFFSALSIARGVSDRRANIGQGTSIVFLSSIAANTGDAGLVNYSASKAALNGAMRSMARELAPLKIRVNSVLPGFVETEMTEKWKDVYDRDYIDQINESYPLGLGTPEDVANMVVFLLGNESAWVTGCEFNVSGGATLGL